MRKSTPDGNTPFDISDTALATACRTLLFSGIREDEARAMLGCLNARIAHYRKDAWLLRAGDAIDDIGIVLEGLVHVQSEDYWGNRNILAAVNPGGLFAESYACVPGMAAQVDVVAAQDCVVLYVDARRIVTSCTSACSFHARLMRNLVAMLARKNIGVTGKVAHLSKRSVREKVLSYLSSEALACGSSEFSIAFNRQQLADYLSVERSALSLALSKLQKDGVISYNKNHFRWQQEITPQIR